MNGKRRTSPQSTCRYSAGSPSNRTATSATARACPWANRSRRTAARKTECPPGYGRSGPWRASSSIRSAVSPCLTQTAICSRYGPMIERRWRGADGRPTGSASARAIVVRLRPNSRAIAG